MAEAPVPVPPSPEPDDGLVVNDALTIARHELVTRATRAGGPGGQHVNTSSTRVEVRWSVAESPSLERRAAGLADAATGATTGRRGAVACGGVGQSESATEPRSRRIAAGRPGAPGAGGAEAPQGDEAEPCGTPAAARCQEGKERQEAPASLAPRLNRSTNIPRTLVPKLATTLRGYTAAAFRDDVIAGLIVGVVALPLCIAFAIASGVSPERGLITGIIGGLLISALGGSRVQIGGPTGAFVVIVYGIVQQYRAWMACWSPRSWPG